MRSIAQVRSAGSAGNYYTDKDNYYVLGSIGVYAGESVREAHFFDYLIRVLLQWMTVI